MQGTWRASRHFGGPETPEPPNIPSSFIRAAGMLEPPASVSPPRPKAVTSTPNAKESNQQPASHHLQTRTMPRAPPGLASRPRTQHLRLAPRKQEVARESQDQNARHYLLPRDFSHFQVQQKREALSQGGSSRNWEQAGSRPSGSHTPPSGQPSSRHMALSPSSPAGSLYTSSVSPKKALSNPSCKPLPPAPTSTLCPLFWRYTEP